MEIPKIIKWEHDHIKVTGVSVAGVGTSLLLPELGVCIDVAQGLNFAFSAKKFLITHAHMDHAAGIPYIISQRALLKQNPPVFYMPQSMVQPMTRIITEWANLEGHDYKYEFIGVEPNKSYELDNHHTFTPFKTLHRVPSQGYTIFEKRKKLKKEFADKSEKEILDLKSRGVDFTEQISLPIFSYTGDTQIEFWDENPWVLKSKILFVEVTYWDDKKPVSAAREWGHIHFEEILPKLEKFEGKKIVFTHVSSRYSKEYVLKFIKERIPKHLQDSVDLFY